MSESQYFIDRILDAMNDCEEMGGPEGRAYLDVMRAVEASARARVDSFLRAQTVRIPDTMEDGVLSEMLEDFWQYKSEGESFAVYAYEEMESYIEYECNRMIGRGSSRTEADRAGARIREYIETRSQDPKLDRSPREHVEAYLGQRFPMVGLCADWVCMCWAIRSAPGADWSGVFVFDDEDGTYSILYRSDLDEDGEDEIRTLVRGLSTLDEIKAALATI